MIAGVGKSYRMLSDAHQLLESGIDVKIGYIETHGRVETEALVEGLPVIPRRKIFYKGKEIEEMDLQSILSIHPEVVIVDELAHTNVEGSKNEKRWQDVMDILDAGISVITAVNIQHIEGLNEMVQDVVCKIGFIQYTLSEPFVVEYGTGGGRSFPFFRISEKGQEARYFRGLLCPAAQ